MIAGVFTVNGPKDKRERELTLACGCKLSLHLHAEHCQSLKQWRTAIDQKEILPIFEFHRIGPDQHTLLQPCRISGVDEVHLEQTLERGLNSLVQLLRCASMVQQLAEDGWILGRLSLRAGRDMPVVPKQEGELKGVERGLLLPVLLAVLAPASVELVVDAEQLSLEPAPLGFHVKVRALEYLVADVGIPRQDGPAEVAQLGLDAGAQQVERGVVGVRLQAGIVRSPFQGHFDAGREAFAHALLDGPRILLGGQVVLLEVLLAVRPHVEQETLARVLVFGREEQRGLQLVWVHTAVAGLVLEDDDRVLPVAVSCSVLQGAQLPGPLVRAQRQ
ncbi:hypothetical protein PG993_008826 [Apiospora rasikravindrae]|uniref:Uncharacterized protein n=1 Tax=Apiospora rasikravindrae TaxID=990691 RepID=A0ABR1SPF6_9PEZI